MSDNKNNYAMHGLDNNMENFFDFDAASSSAFLPRAHDNPAQQKQIIEVGENTQIMPLTQSEIDVIIALRTAKAIHSHPSQSLAPLVVNEEFSGFQEADAYEGALGNDRMRGLILPDVENSEEVDMSNYGVGLMNTSAGFEALGYSGFEASADCPGAAGEFVPVIGGQFAHFRVEKGNVGAQTTGIIDISQSSVNVLDSNPTAINQFMGEASYIDHLLLQDKEEMQSSHYEAANKAQQAWSIGKNCTWVGCSSQAVFKTLASFNTHFRNTHSKPLLCDIPNCHHQRPFGRESDLKRHHLSAHSAQRTFVCTVPSCDARIKEFARKDHLTKHMRERHDNYFCPLNHCKRSKKSSFDSPQSVAEHIAMDHGSYECALGACAASAASKFCRSSLNSHLRNDHHLDYLGSYTIYGLISGTEFRQPMTVQGIDFGRASWIECKVCGK